jgi:MFS transporter, DHA3 family, macrolide efflux protein
MQMLRPLRSRPLALVWTSQILSATGAEFYTVAVVWVAAALIGSDAGYVAAIQSAMLLAGSLFGGILTDRWRTGTTMVAMSLARGLLVLVLAAAALAGWMSLTLLALVTALVALASACFEPALQSIIPVLAGSPAARHATNGLFDATRRVARILGPGLIAAASFVMPVGHFFGVTALAFLVSAACVSAGLRRLDLPRREPVHGIAGVLDALTGGVRAVRRHAVMVYGLLASVATNITWSLGIILGMALHLRATSADPLVAYSLMMAGYGVGNVLASVVLSARQPRRPIVWIIIAKLLFGAGVALLPFAGSGVALLLVAGVAAINGPFDNLALFHIMQNDFPTHRLAQVFRLLMATVFGGSLIAYLAAPALFGAFGVGPVVAASGVATAAIGLAGLPLALRGRR